MTVNTTEEYIFEQHLKSLETKWDEFSRQIKDIQTPDTFSVLFSTDIHYIRKYAKYVPSYYKVKEMVDFSKFAGFDLLALTGDIVDGNTTIERQKRDLNDIINLIRGAKTSSVVVSKGNHDDCSWFAFANKLEKNNVISPELWYSYVINPVRVQYPISIDENNKAGGYYYIDYPLHKIRVINLNTSDMPCVLESDGTLKREYCAQWNFGLSEKQIQWICNSLKFTEDGWSVMFMSHTFLLKNEVGLENVKNGDLAWEIIQGYMKKTKGSVKSSEKYFEAEVHYDFTDNHSNDILPYLCGHNHKDVQTVQDGVTVISAQNILGDCTAEWDSDGKIKSGWDCVLIDKKKRTIHIKRYGNENADKIMKF